MERSVKKSTIGIVFNHQKNKVLLVKRRDVPVWVLPGGGVDPQELPSDAAIREVYEETGCSVTIVRHAAIYTPVNRLANLTYVYECQVQEGNLTISAETQDVAFFDLNKLPASFFFIHRDWLNEVLNSPCQTIQKPLDQINYFNLFKYFCRHPYLVLRFALSRFGMPINFNE